MSENRVHGQCYLSVSFYRCMDTEYSVRSTLQEIDSSVAPCRPAFWNRRKNVQAITSDTRKKWSHLEPCGEFPFYFCSLQHCSKQFDCSSVFRWSFCLRICFNLTCWPLSGKLFLNFLPKFSQVVTQNRSHVYIRKPIRQQVSLFYRLLLSFIFSVPYTPVRWSSFETFLSKPKFFIDAINRHTITYATYYI